MQLLSLSSWNDFTFSSGVLPLARLEYVLIAVTVYLLVVFGLREWIRSRTTTTTTSSATSTNDLFELHPIVVPAHNFFLCGLSFIMLCGLSWQVLLAYFSVTTRPAPSTTMAQEFFCDEEKRLTTGPIVFWFYVFYLSKYYELLDTVIIVLKNRPVIFLHVYHHCITLLLSFVMMDNGVAVQWLDITANVLVHVPMYFYYAVSSLGISVWWKKYITLLQIVQFLVDIGGNLIGLYYIHSGHNCGGTPEVWWFGQAVLFSFLVLFLAFYRSTYNPGDAKLGRNSQKKD